MPRIIKQLSSFIIVFAFVLSSYAKAKEVDKLQNKLQTDSEKTLVENAESDKPEGELQIGSEEALLKSATSYAADYGVNVDEALKRLRLQNSVKDTLTKLEKSTRSRFAGAWIEHKPNFRVVVRLTGNSQVLPNDAQSMVSKSVVPIKIVTGAKATLSQLVDNIDSKLPELRKMHSKLAGAEVDVKTGEIVLFVEQDKVAEARIKNDARQFFGLPVRIESVDAPVSDGHTRGGAHLSTCTSGFVVKHPSTGTRGYVTAGHCGNNQTYFEYGGTSYSTTFIGEIRDADQDVQWHTTPHIEQPYFYASSTTSYRPLQGQKNRSSQTVGGYVCHRGKTTGYSCGNIQSKTFKPTYTNACPGVTCASVWIRVAGSSLKCFPGDSGGPWFLVYDAYGIYKGQSSSGTTAAGCNWAFYMAVDYLGISLVFD